MDVVALAVPSGSNVSSSPGVIPMPSIVMSLPPLPQVEAVSVVAEVPAIPSKVSEAVMLGALLAFMLDRRVVAVMANRRDGVVARDLKEKDILRAAVVHFPCELVRHMDDVCKAKEAMREYLILGCFYSNVLERHNLVSKGQWKVVTEDQGRRTMELEAQLAEARWALEQEKEQRLKNEKLVEEMAKRQIAVRRSWLIWKWKRRRLRRTSWRSKRNWSPRRN
ncbi:uncharacterized protein LOC133801797 [Humulus lupulus]|uniref:uncharacterized protein LOC133801797 n=1 Tax=Humulus lupulus TaxID=3486 RepID=UPI002B40E9B4|nr:uncharacterized protein LOC133801797 [Humulus lupulus]